MVKLSEVGDCSAEFNHTRAAGRVPEDVADGVAGAIRAAMGDDVARGVVGRVRAGATGRVLSAGDDLGGRSD
jgi:hypothetical protein